MIRELRLRQVKNMLATLLLARGIPMLLGGDEFGRSQRGNNNAYCQDNDTSWYDWTLAEQHAGLVRFVQRLIALRKSHPALRAERFYTADEIEWLGPRGAPPNWEGLHNRLGCVIRDEATSLALLFNATTDSCEFDVSNQGMREWCVRIDTSRHAPDDAPEEPSAARVPDPTTVRVEPRSLIVLEAARDVAH